MQFCDSAPHLPSSVQSSYMEGSSMRETKTNFRQRRCGNEISDFERENPLFPSLSPSLSLSLGRCQSNFCLFSWFSIFRPIRIHPLHSKGASAAPSDGCAFKARRPSAGKLNIVASDHSGRKEVALIGRDVLESGRSVSSLFSLE